MGSFSIYGYGDRGLFVPVPCEQFFEKEYDEYEMEDVTHRIISPTTGDVLHLMDKGPVCNYSGTAYSTNASELSQYVTAEEIYCEKFKLSEQKEKDKYKRSVSSTECITSVPKIVNNLIKIDVEKYSKQLFNKYDGKYSINDCTLNNKGLFMNDPEERQKNALVATNANEETQENLEGLSQDNGDQAEE